MLANHRRALWYSLALISGLVFMLVAVGRHPAAEAPATTVPLVGTLDLTVYRWMDDIRNPPLSGLFRVLNVLGSGIVTIPLRAVVSIVLAIRTRWRACAAFLLTWSVTEIGVSMIKGYFHRGRPPGPLVEVFGSSFPSGHAVAAAATAVALVLVFFPPGPKRRRYEWLAVGFAFTMAFSRVYLYAHWLSDVVAGVMLGAGIALGSVALVTEVRDVWLRRLPVPVTDQSPDQSEERAG